MNSPKVMGQSATEIVGIALRVHPNQIVVHDGTQKLAAPGKSAENLGSGPGDMMEVPDQVRDTNRPQLCGQWDQMIVVNPHQIVRADQLRESVRERPVNPQVALV